MTTNSVLAQLAEQIAAQQTQLQVSPGMPKQGQGGYSLGGMQAKNYVNQGLPPPPLGTMPMRSLEATDLMSRSKDPTRPDRYGQWVAKRQMGKKAIETEKAHQAELYQKQMEAQKGKFEALYKFALSKGMKPEQAKQMAILGAQDEDVAEKMLEQWGAPPEVIKPGEFQKKLDYAWNIEDPEKRQFALDMLVNENAKDKMSLVADGQGGFRLAINGEPVDMGAMQTKASQDKVTQQLTDSTVNLNRIHDIAGKFRPEFLQTKGAVKGFIGQWSDILNIPSDVVDRVTGEENVKMYSAKRKAFVNQAYRRVLEHRKELTGVQGSEKEMQKIENSLSNAAENSPTQFMIALEDELQESYRMYNAQRAILRMPPIDFDQPEYQIKWGGSTESYNDEKTGDPIIDEPSNSKKSSEAKNNQSSEELIPFDQ